MNAYQSFYNWIEYYEKTDGQTIGRGSVKFLEKKSSKAEVIYGSYYLVKYQLYILDEELELFEETPQAGVILQVGNESIIEGISEALHSMRVGEKSRFYIPYFLAFGENGNQYVSPFSHLYMIIEVVEKVETGN
jgi:FKBP-type peptidyl-prolyl cis-trans isomerase 2